LRYWCIPLRLVIRYVLKHTPLFKLLFKGSRHWWLKPVSGKVVYFFLIGRLFVRITFKYHIFSIFLLFEGGHLMLLYQLLRHNLFFILIIWSHKLYYLAIFSVVGVDFWDSFRFQMFFILFVQFFYVQSLQITHFWSVQ
jgi:hypothetical protein